MRVLTNVLHVLKSTQCCNALTYSNLNRTASLLIQSHIEYKNEADENELHG